jgi:hypothetical protein
MEIETGEAILPPAQADKDSRLVLDEEHNEKKEPPQSGGPGGRTDGSPAETNLQEDTFESMQVSPQKEKSGQASKRQALKANAKPAASEGKKGETATPLAQMYNTQDQQMEIDEALTAGSSGPNDSDNPLQAAAGLEQATQEASKDSLSSSGSQQTSPPGKRGPESLPSPDGKAKPQRPRVDADIRNTDLGAFQAARNELSHSRQDTISGKEAAGDDSSTVIDTGNRKKRHRPYTGGP